MPIIYKQEIEDHAILGVWKISESVEELLSMIQFTEGERETFEKFKLKSRQAHWLSYRLAIRQLLGNDKQCDFYYDEHGKLHFSNLNYSLSVTHSGLYSGVIISKKHYVGIDIEKLGERINILAHKFLNKEELDRLPEVDQHKYLTVIWSAKEALYKQALAHVKQGMKTSAAQLPPTRVSTPWPGQAPLVLPPHHQCGSQARRLPIVPNQVHGNEWRYAASNPANDPDPPVAPGSVQYASTGQPFSRASCRSTLLTHRTQPAHGRA